MSAAAAALTGLVLAAPAVVAAPDDEFVVTADRAPRSQLDLVGNTARLGPERIRITNAQHINELGNAATGTWLSRGSGQENLTAIRSPVLTGPGACGAFLILEASIPSRPAGFCNVNELFELPSELARSVEIVRGPSNALYGSNGLHGTLNVILPEPGANPGWYGGATVGPDSYYRGKLGWDSAIGGGLNGGLLLDDYGGYRADSGYTQQKGFVRYRQPLAGGTIDWTLSAQHLDQQTAGYIEGKDAYKDPALVRTNPTPGAFRKADSERLSAHWHPAMSVNGAQADVRVYARRSRMKFLQHFIPGEPEETNGQVSGGMIATYARPWRAGRITWGLDVEWMNAFIEQYQAGPTDSGSPFLDATLPQGWQYDFSVRSSMAAPYARLEMPLGNAWTLTGGLRAEYLRYDYDNRMLDGNTRDDGTPCGFGGCRYNRPADRDDTFINFAPTIGIAYRVDPHWTVYSTLSRGFRAPQATEMYRLQNQQDVADLDSVTLDSLEAGTHWQTDRFRVEVSAFAMRKQDYIFQDANRNNISDGRSRHVGIELQAAAQFGAGFYASAAATWADHTYAFTQDARGERIIDGNEIDTAPRTLGSVRIGRDTRHWLAEAEAVHIGEYYLDAANAHRYAGHNLLNLRGLLRLSRKWSLTARVNNVTDESYADRADFAFGNYRYFPGRPREFFVELDYRMF